MDDADEVESVASSTASAKRWQHRKQVVDDYLSSLSSGGSRNGHSASSLGSVDSRHRRPRRTTSPPDHHVETTRFKQSQTSSEQPRRVWESQGWMSSTTGPHEDERRRILERFHLKSVGQVKALDRVAQLAQTMFQVPLVAVTLFLEDHEKLASTIGWDNTEQTNPSSPTTFPLNSALTTSSQNKSEQDDNGLVIEDCRDDYRFRNHPWMLQGKMVFLATANIYLPTRPSHTPTSNAIALPDKLPVGSLCVIDKQPRSKDSFDQSKQQTLKSLADMIGHEFELAFERQRAQLAAEQAAYLGQLFQSQMVFQPSNRGPPKTMSADDHQSVVENVCKLINADTAALIDLRSFHGPNTSTNVSSSNLNDSRQSSPTGSGSPPPQQQEQPDSSSPTRQSSPESAHTTGSQEWYTQSAQTRPGSSTEGMFGRISVAAQTGFDWSTHLQQRGATASIHHFLFAFHNDGNSEFDSSTIPSPLADLLPPQTKASLSVPVLDSTRRPVFLLIVCSFRNYFRFESEDKVFVENCGAVLIANILRKKVIDADRAKLSFVSQVSHELRTPLFAVGGQLELIRQLTKSYPQVSKTLTPLLDVAEVCVTSLKEVLDDTLEFSKMTSRVEGQIQPPPSLTEVHLGHLVQDVVKSVWARVRQAASASGSNSTSRGEVSILFENKLKRPRAVVDVGGLKRVLFNTLGNSLKFTERGHVKVTLNHQPIQGEPTMSNLLIQVSDTGKGMSQEFIDTCLFVPFKQADEFSQGAGLGVSISDAICRRMKGSLQYSSIIGRGTTATITFPVELLLPLPNDEPTDRNVRNLSAELNEVFNPIKNGLSKSNGSSSPKPTFETTKFTSSLMTEDRNQQSSTWFSDSMATPTVERVSPPFDEVIRVLSPTESNDSNNETRIERLLPPKSDQVKVLVVDDNPIGRSIKFVDATNGVEAVERFKTFKPNLVWCDMQMPIMDGIEATRLMRQYETEQGLDRAKIVAISGFSNQDKKTKHLLESGQIDDWMTKGGPTTLKQLAAGLESFKSQLEQQRQQQPTPSPSLSSSSNEVVAASSPPPPLDQIPELKVQLPSPVIQVDSQAMSCTMK
ncbi:hypothetical protein OIO90_002729 [Microbotryomycetes sp. JL221]|nr:hypothetical protein OIO90_002729 [Microbotryomycetes sp. JL221]